MFIIELAYASVFFILIIMFIVVKFLRKKYNIMPYPSEYQHVNVLHKRIEFILALVALILLVLSYIFEHSLTIILLVFSLLLITFVFRFYMQYKHEPEEKEYLITLVQAIGFFIITFGGIILYFMV
ncbi:DUF4181 domain-containing protein [Filobacillus milosensis]|nr:DUF4181 domain-containing protein [Filobacillus milosensis]